MNSNEKKYAALTFDDGPTEITLQVLEILKKHDIKASFFVVGDNLHSDNGAITKKCAEYGNEICNHSKTHSAMPDFSTEEIKAEIEYTDEKAKEQCGYTTKFFRPPYIAYNQTMFDAIEKPFICGYGADDWDDNVSADERVERILAQSTNGMIILLHDMQGNVKTVEAIDRIIPAMKADGYEFVTVSQLFDRCGTVPQCGKIYSNAFDN